MKQYKTVIFLTLMISIMLCSQMLKVRPKTTFESINPVMFQSVQKNETNPSDFELIFSEDFEQLSFPPNGWEQSITNPDYTWHLDDMYAHMGNYSACCLHDVNASYQDEWIITPNIDMSNHSDEYLCFNFFMSYFWSVYPYDTYDLNVYISKENESNWHLIWNEEQTDPFENWNWINTSKN